MLGGTWAGSSVGVSEYASDGGVSRSGEKVLCGTALGGRDGNDLSSSIVLLLVCLCRAVEFFVFFRRLAISPSWHSIQNIPCEVLA